jgi:hypothetical protein
MQIDSDYKSDLRAATTLNALSQQFSVFAATKKSRKSTPQRSFPKGYKDTFPGVLIQIDFTGTGYIKRCSPSPTPLRFNHSETPLASQTTPTKPKRKTKPSLNKTSKKLKVEKCVTAKKVFRDSIAKDDVVIEKRVTRSSHRPKYT